MARKKKKQLERFVAELQVTAIGNDATCFVRIAEDGSLDDSETWIYTGKGDLHTLGVGSQVNLTLALDSNEIIRPYIFKISPCFSRDGKEERVVVRDEIYNKGLLTWACGERGSIYKTNEGTVAYNRAQTFANRQQREQQREEKERQRKLKQEEAEQKHQEKDRKRKEEAEAKRQRSIQRENERRQRAREKRERAKQRAEQRKQSNKGAE